MRRLAPDSVYSFRREPSLVDEEWHAVRGTTFYNYKELHQAVKCDRSAENRKA